MKKPIVVVYSGGMDSFTLLNDLSQAFDSIHALTFDYGQRHRKEIEYAKKVCSGMENVTHTVVDLSSLRPVLGASTLTSDEEVPDGHYESAVMKKTVVPNRNMILSAIAAGYAVSIGAETVYLGIHAGDHAIYPDCRPEFVAAMNRCLGVANYAGVALSAPYIHSTKAEIAAIGADLGVDYVNAWTCYKGGDQPCGRCGACCERQEAMQISGATDTTEYQDSDYWRQFLTEDKKCT